jgi:hypothetical protein
MKYRRTYRPVARRVIAGLMAAVLGGVGSLAIATPSQAAAPCTLSFTATSMTFDERGNPRGPWWVNGTITNTGSVTSSLWIVYVPFPNRLNLIAWDLQAAPNFEEGWYTSTDANKAIPPGQSVTFRFVVAMTSPEISGMPSQYFCSIL